MSPDTKHASLVMATQIQPESSRWNWKFWWKLENWTVFFLTHPHKPIQKREVFVQWCLEKSNSEFISEVSKFHLPLKFSSQRSLSDHVSPCQEAWLHTWGRGVQNLTANAELKALESFFGIFGFAVIVFIIFYPQKKKTFFMKILSGFLSGLVHKTRGFTFIHPKNMGGGTPQKLKK